MFIIVKMETTTLFKQTRLGSKDKILVWECGVTDSTVKTRHYYLGTHNIPQFIETIITGKNVNRVNATTPHQQALLEAKRRTIDKMKQGFKYNLNETARFDVILPMLLTDGSPSICSEEMLAQPKLDGVRCVAYVKPSGEIVLQSRTGKLFPFLSHIRNELLNSLDLTRVYDGELYVHGIKQQELVSMANVTLKSPNDNETLVQYYIFDIVDNFLSQHDRLNILLHLQLEDTKYIQFVPWCLIRSPGDCQQKLDEYISQGYEGIVLRKLNGLYKNHRSRSAFKIKKMDTSECIIVGFTEGKGTEAGAVVWICEMNGKRFKCRPSGTFDERKKLFSVATSYYGKKYQIQHQGLSRDNIPRFPIGLCFRDYE